MRNEDKQDIQLSVTDLDAIKENTEKAVVMFAERYLPLPHFTERSEVMDQARLRDAMGLRATFESGDPWPAAEQKLLEMGFRWHLLGSQRVMYVMDRDDLLQSETDGWQEPEEIV